jgi:GNAT superfamily N-acetyltransferase
MTLRIREMSAQDAPVVARLHACSWRSAYRNILSDCYLDGPVFEDRLTTWSRQLSAPPAGAFGLVADDEAEVQGFLFAVAGQHQKWGSYLDSLHVSPSQRGHGIGTKLLLDLRARLLGRRIGGGLYLWAVQENKRACDFYEGLGAVALDHALHDVPGGKAVAECLYWWQTLEHLCSNLSDGTGSPKLGERRTR